jgi:hypothetical protein
MQKNVLRVLCVLAIFGPMVYRAIALALAYPDIQPEPTLFVLIVSGLGLIPAIGLNRLLSYGVALVTARILVAGSEAYLVGSPPEWAPVALAVTGLLMFFALIWLLSEPPPTTLEREMGTDY